MGPPLVLFYGIPSEPPLAMAIRAAADAGVPAVVLNQRRAHEADLCVDVDDAGCRGSLCVRGQEWDLSAFTGVYLRMTDLATLPEYRTTPRTRPDPDRLHRAHALDDLLLEWCELAPVRVANRPSAMASNVSKPYQAQLIARCGFEVPPTLVSNEPQEVRAFAAEHGRVVFKSTSSVRSIVQELDEEGLQDLDRVRSLPTQFQALVPGVDVRVHVTGAALFATEARSSAVDYRYSGRDGLEVAMEPVELPGEVAARCRALARELALPLAGIDLRRRPDGRWCCFEVNPSPAFSWYAQTTGQPIAEGLVDWLAGGG
jgi:hypothetical protein